MKKLLVILVCALLCGTPLWAFGKKAPDISNAGFLPREVVAALTISDGGAGGRAREAAGDEVRISINWDKVTKPFEQRYALYRASRAAGSAAPMETYAFVAFLPLPPTGSLTTTVSDTAVRRNTEYRYQIFYTQTSFGGETVARPEDMETLQLGALPRHIQPKSIRPWAVTTPPAPPPPAAGSTATAGKQPEKPAASSGVYVGLLAFSNDALDITKKYIRGAERGALLPLDTHRAKDMLLKQFSAAYHLSESYGTSIYYALHKAIVNIENNMSEEGALPTDINSIHIVVITDGYDNNSSNPDLKPPLSITGNYTISEEQRRGESGGYPDFFKRKVFLPQGINGVKLTTWIFGIKNSETPDELPDSEFNHLKTILNTGEANSVIGDVRNLEQELSKVLNNLDTLSDYTHVFAAMPALTNDAQVTVQIAPAAFIKAKVLISGGKNYLTDITAEPPELLAVTPTRLNYIEMEGVKGYEFILNGDYYSRSAGRSMVDAISVDTDTTPLGGEAFVNVNPYNFSFKRASALVYFVIDNSKSLGEKNIAIVRSSVQNTIEQLFRLNVSGTEGAEGILVAGQPAAAPSSESIFDGYNSDEPAKPALNPALPPRESVWPPAFIAFVKKFAPDNLPWRTKTSNTSPLNSGADTLGWYIQAGAYSNREAAQAAQKTLENAGFSGIHIYAPFAADGLYKVHIGPFDEAHINGALSEVRVIWRTIMTK